MQKTNQEKYERWARLSACASMAIGIGIIPLGIGFFHGIHVIEQKPSVFLGLLCLADCLVRAGKYCCGRFAEEGQTIGEGCRCKYAA